MLGETTIILNFFFVALQSMTLKALLTEVAYSLHRLTSVGQIAAMRTLMTVFLDQAYRPSVTGDSAGELQSGGISVFQKDQDLLLQLVKPIAELFARNFDPKTTTNYKQITYIKKLAQEVLVMFTTVFK